ncbi:TonB-dependent receptor [Novosphingobium flavum]|uniref:TonB-dependent receptor n=1 Tax=Novosphingobium flavum TaxID=1778672 RepID=A0A7X1KL36_9SPHN|nr:TonB-dependent receptor [Novosphingobium flavum]MBC2665142.1 TonB-dependent receptor [Novosphingobium flavum]
MNWKAGSCLLLLTTTAVPVWAEADGPIVVTAPGGAIDLDEARRLGPEALDASARPDLARALERGVPGLTLGEATGNPWQAAIGWRGFSASALQGSEQGLAVYLDGVRFNQPFGDVVLMDLLPEAALVSVQLNEASPVLGRNALAGSLLLQTGDGVSLAGLRAESDVDSIGGHGGALSLGLGGQRDNLLIVAEARHDPGWRAGSPSTLGRLFAKGQHSDEGWGIELSGLAAASRLTGNGVAPVELLAADWRAVFTRPDVTRTRFARVVAAPWIDVGSTGRIELTAHFQALSRRSANGDLADFGPCEDDAGLLCLEDDDGEFEEPLLSNGAPLAAVPVTSRYAVFNRGDEQTHSGGAMLQWRDQRETAKGTRRLALGMVAEWARTRFTATSELGVLGADRVVTGLGPVVTSEDGAIQPVDLVNRMSDVALFASAELPLTRRLSVEAGARWSRNAVTLDDRIGAALDGHHVFTRLNPSIELDYALTPKVRASAGFSLTGRNPTPAELSCADPEAPCTLANFFVSDPPLVPVTARNWKLGLSGEGRGMSWRLGLWRADTRHDIRMIASGVRGRAYFANLGRSRRQGIEASAEWQRLDGAGRGWRLSASYALTDARFREGFTMSSPNNPAADDDGEIAVRRGDRLPGVPRHALDLNAVRQGAGWQVGLTMRARSGQYLLGDEGNDTAPTAPYAVFDLDGRIALAPGIELAAQVRNLLDRRYVTAGTFAEIGDIDMAEAPGASDPRALAPAAPRRLTVSLRARF